MPTSWSGSTAGDAAASAVLDEAVLVRWAVDGNRVALRALLRIVVPLAVRYCRARIGRQDGNYAVADAVAGEVRDAALRDLLADARPAPRLSTVVYRAAVRAVDARRPQPPALIVVLPPALREVVVLRNILRLTPAATADALGWSVHRVLRAEQRILRRLADTDG